MKLKITKRYARKISKDWQTWEFMTEITQEDVEVNSKEELLAESDKLFSKVKGLTDVDIVSVQSEIQPKQLEKK